ncbi:unnamed protein product [Cylindrotheca closterium]|uniref:Major facilitator superfamily (MFS) profile domain-containing protein n=1 Tax=Cylindrotheca closterium TaxID=2856 RepID=A0AAD2JH51_9STRA|nr:unnamed protein product [Cylindrotheca closterium]
MCKPTIETKESIHTTNSDAATSHHRGFLYGTISLAFAITANSVTMGHMQSRRDALGCDSLCIGSMTSARSTLTLVGSTIVGRLSDSKALDRLGGARKFCLLIGIFASAAELLIASQASTMSTFWMSLVPAALLNQNFTVLKALFGDYHGESAGSAERAGSVGKLGMAAGLAFMIGPLASSKLLSTYEQAAACAAFCLLVAALFIFLLPTPKEHSSSKPNQNGESDKNSEASTAPKKWWSKIVPDFVPAARTPPALFIMSARVCMTLAFHIFQTIWTVALKERFNFGPKEYGQYFGFIGFAYAISQGFLAKFLIQKFASTNKGRARILLVCSLVLGGGRMFAYQTNSIVAVYAIFCGIITALGIVNTIFTADTSKIASPQELGGLFGVLSSVESMAGIAGPMIGGALSKVHPQQGPLMAVMTLYGIVFTLVYWGYERYVGVHNDEASKKKTV